MQHLVCRYSVYEDSKYARMKQSPLVVTKGLCELSQVIKWVLQASALHLLS